jgi:hypothetical protein
VGDNVGDGVTVGNPSVGVELGDPKPVMGMTGWAVCVSAAAMVCAMAVPTLFGSGVESTGEAHASDAPNKTTTANRSGLNFNIFSTFRLTGPIIIVKTFFVQHLINVVSLHLFHFAMKGPGETPRRRAGRDAV